MMARKGRLWTERLISLSFCIAPKYLIMAKCDHTFQTTHANPTPRLNRIICTKCGHRTTSANVSTGSKLQSSHRSHLQRYTYEKGYEQGKADRAKGTQADIPFNAPHLLKQTQVKWGRGYVDGWNGAPMAENRGRMTFSEFLSETKTTSLNPKQQAALDALKAMQPFTVGRVRGMDGITQTGLNVTVLTSLKAKGVIDFDAIYLGGLVRGLTVTENLT